MKLDDAAAHEHRGRAAASADLRDAAPGTVRIGSSRSVLPSASISVESRTVTAAPTCDCGTSPAVARDDDVLRHRADLQADVESWRAPAATNSASDVRVLESGCGAPRPDSGLP